MALQRMRPALLRVWSAAPLLLLLGCSPEIETGHFVCEVAADCPTDWYCWSNGFCYDTPEVSGGDGSVADGGVPRDAEASDARPRDATADAGRRPDADVPPDDAGAADGAIGDAGCVSRFGELCQREGFCGARVSCAGECLGGETPEVCSCAELVCQSDGTWSSCTDPETIGTSCSTDEVCGGALDCDGNCAGGEPRPDCACGAAECGPTGAWSACPGPSNYGERCDTPTSCGGTIDCNGGCTGGAPLPSCECGTPTCGGCTGGTCGANSQCVQGSCVCTVDACDCAASEQSCTLCQANGNLGFCSVDAYGCGSLGEVEQFCTYGCTASPSPQCQCHPNTGEYCAVRICNCNCGSYPLDGTVQCDGLCEPSFYLGCPALCSDYCLACNPICR